MDDVKRSVRELTSGVFIPGVHFEITDYKDLRYIEDSDIEDPYNIILYQFFGDVIFH